MAVAQEANTDTSGRTALLAACVLVIFLLAMTVTIANVSLPQIQGSLSATRDQVAWVVTAYLVANAVGLPATGWLTDRFGSRRLIVWGTIGFSISTLLCAMAPNLETLVLLRAMQGLFGAPVMPLSMALVMAAYPRSQHGMVTSIFGIGVTIGPIIAPWLGGILTEDYGWRSVFYFCLPFAAMACLGVIMVIPKDRPQAMRRLDLRGFIFFSVAIACFQLMVDRGERNDWFDSVEIALECLAGVICLYLFVVHSLTWRQPYIDLRILANRDLVVGLLLVAAFGMLSYSPLVLLPNLLQNLRGYPEEMIGVLLAIRGLGMTLGFVFLLWGSRFDPRIWLALGFGGQIWAGWEMALFDINVTYFQLAWTGFISGLGIGFVWVPLTVITLGAVTPAQFPLVTSIFHLLRLFGSSVHISLSVALALRTSKISFAEIAERLQPGRPALWNMETAIPSAQQAMPIVREIGRQAQMIGYLNAFMFFALTAVVAMPLILAVRPPRNQG
ncbi:MAG: DHA2 family efflux MFS transporter permease subunit [Rhodospirillaceae bacterium]|jgi:MFS transporter, DHA2 family, multidrug resistance protein|nr:DHA2 family efflux MFS transporter permease subunit [Rhodospirillaceae bacterium]MBT4490643.1 DHA2 family efflux MFS transporter permease subunit [Rhodospirillaceae bacterium]MBT5193479.1 DHA2 family efflux MFS transporter permease subunit [Rhodospirillaceae bacterium]MBT5894400.1 DHA2 family efflux MFS transporter permease subunit [Rhodospirillaceae bacterium]MBT7756599.1 DHA2 family efflux MFS transporter permease subunit [Rhodospirillaceae bacterium]